MKRSRFSEATFYLRKTCVIRELRAYNTTGTDRSSVRYQSVKADDAPIRERLWARPAERRRFGYYRLPILMTRED